MDEATWQACADPRPMLAFLRGTVSDRKLQLFFVACCRRVWHLLIDPRSRRAVEVTELLADGLATKEELSQAVDAAGDATEALDEAAGAHWEGPDACAAGKANAVAEAGHAAWNTGWVRFAFTIDHPLFAEEHLTDALDYLAHAIAYDATHAPYFFHTDVANGTVPDSPAYRAWRAARAPEVAAQAHLLRDIAGSPFRPVRLDRAWLSWNYGIVPKLATAIYEDGAFERLPILADALEEAGWAEPAILDHLRGLGPHARGCHLLDAILGKE
jgi:hypothetical protein